MSFPNLLGDEFAKVAKDRVQSFEALIKSNCAEDLKFYLCSLNFPMCTEKIPQPIGPCQPLCKTVREKCLPLLRDFGFDWPEYMNCSNLPKENNGDMMCMPGPSTKSAFPAPKTEEAERNEEQGTHFEQNGFVHSNGHQKCSDDFYYFNRTGVCVPLCNGQRALHQTDRYSTSTYLSVLCGLSVFFTVSSIIFFLTRPHILPTFPERSLLWSAISFMLSSIIYVFSLLYREEISCREYAGFSLSVVASLPHIPCTAVAAALFYLGTAGRLWWFIMCLAWKEHTLQTASIDKYRRQVCLLTWTLPLAVVMLALMAKSVQADPLSGLCLVGSANKVLEGVFPVFRECIMFFVVIVPLFSGCCSLVGSSPVSPSPNTHPHPSHLGLLGCVYLVAAFFYVFAYLHDILQPAMAWTRSWNIVSAIKLLIDPFMGAVAGFFCLVIIISNQYRANRAPSSFKAGYQPAPLPQSLPPNRPQPEVPRPISSTYTGTYAAAPHFTR
ncbi:unnamed protein product, partial [Mesorhabditis belari]|uniref:Frizzled-4 n=1 Tax=Mesorhabditis belari TaxID=2138241 RepID=A0AAF3F569_9BILA